MEKEVETWKAIIQTWSVSLFRFGRIWRLILFFSWVSKRYTVVFFFQTYFPSLLAGAFIYCRSFGCTEIFEKITKYWRYLSSSRVGKVTTAIFNWGESLNIHYLTMNGSFVNFLSFFFFLVKKGHCYLQKPKYSSWNWKPHLLPHILSLHSGATKHSD